MKEFLAYAAEENLEAVEVAKVEENPRLVMNWRGKTIVDISRAFLDTNGAHQEVKCQRGDPDEKPIHLFKEILKMSEENGLTH